MNLFTFTLFAVISTEENSLDMFFVPKSKGMGHWGKDYPKIKFIGSIFAAVFLDLCLVKEGFERSQNPRYLELRGLYACPVSLSYLV